MTMKINYKLMALASAVLLTTSCIKEGRDESCPADLRVIYNWDEAEPLLDTDSLMIVGEDGTVRFLKTSTTGSELDLPDGKYCMTAYEGNPNVDVKDSIVTAKQLPDGSWYELTPFRAGVNTFNVKSAEASGPLEIVMRRQTRLLQVKVHFIGTGLKFLEGVNGNLNGVSVARHIAHGFPPFDREPRHPAITASILPLDFEKVATRAGQVSLQQDFNTEKRLLGLDGNTNQELGLQLNLGDLTRELKLSLTEDDENNVLRFHVDNVEEPFVIEVTIRLGADFTADIVDWKTGAESDLEGH